MSRFCVENYNRVLFFVNLTQFDSIKELDSRKLTENQPNFHDWLPNQENKILCSYDYCDCFDILDIELQKFTRINIKFGFIRITTKFSNQDHNLMACEMDDRVFLADLRVGFVRKFIKTALNSRLVNFIGQYNEIKILFKSTQCTVLDNLSSKSFAIKMRVHSK